MCVYLIILFLGSFKIATKCTSTITIKVDHEKQVHVDICYTRHGHRKSLEHLRLPKCQRAMIAAKIQQGVTRERAFGLQRVQRHGNDQLSVLAWIGEWESSEESESPVLYYKFQGEEDKNGHDLTTDDFFLGQCRLIYGYVC